MNLKKAAALTRYPTVPDHDVAGVFGCLRDDRYVTMFSRRERRLTASQTANPFSARASLAKASTRKHKPCLPVRPTWQFAGRELVLPPPEFPCVFKLRSLVFG